MVSRRARIKATLAACFSIANAGWATELPPPDPRFPPQSPVQPGKVQKMPGPELIPPAQVTKDLTVWVFADIKLTVLDPTRVKIRWQSHQGAAWYRVIRSGVAIADVPQQPPPLSFVDEGLTPGVTATYRVQALQLTPPTAVSPSMSTSTSGEAYHGVAIGGSKLTTKEVVLETSREVSATTPALAPPIDVTVTTTSLNSVRLTWTPPRWATGYRVFRDSQPLKAASGNSVDDTAVPPGTHTYSLQTMFAKPDGTPLPGPVSREAAIRVGPFVVVSVGDSVMWGQGLAGPSKFTTKVRNWLIGRMGKDVLLVPLAHSGARTASGTASQETMVTPGEVPNFFPSIPHQATVLAPGAIPVRPADVDLVLVDGCINDVGVRTILDPSTTTTLIANQTLTFCRLGMATLLGQIHTAFPRAKIVITGYFPIVSQDSDLTAVSMLLMHVGAVSAATAPLFGIPVDPISALITGAVTSKALKDNLVSHSDTFFQQSNRELQMATNMLNGATGNFATFVPIPYGPQNAYAASDSWLWLVPTSIGERDEVFDARAATCNNNTILTTAGSTSSSLAVDKALCIEASMGHPNVKGAQAYADAITSRLNAFVPQWLAVHASTQRAP